jgi:hypothetical protein
MNAAVTVDYNQKMNRLIIRSLATVSVLVPTGARGRRPEEGSCHRQYRRLAVLTGRSQHALDRTKEVSQKSLHGE